jgi:phosphoesterase RecJ-like protein
MGIDWDRFAEIVGQHESFVLSSHMRPDCDALGSELGMAHLLRSLGKRVQFLIADVVPRHSAFIDLDGEIDSLEAADAPAMPAADVWMILDTSAWSQLGPVADLIRASSAQRVVIDHHVGCDQLDAELFKDETSDSTGRLVLDAMEALDVEPTPAIAMALLAAISTDTGWFRFSSVGEKTFLAAAKLVAAGASPTQLFANLFENHSFARLQLQGRVMTGAAVDLGGRVIYSNVSLQDLTETGAEVTDTEDVINRLLSVGGVEVGLLFLELEPGLVKVSVRSRTDFDARKLAEQFGGGGHRAAAGLRIDATLAEAEQAVLDAVRAAME